ncbi:STAS domain-containing protein [Streptomyces sp. ICBB 8177]|uniref:STAS domain-containing protein n=1 Tax=Streptomyces sp. ICBB 8177 TaxID=563922 RepID=UPI000D672C7F|nr:STAS domain-containing protein [Streptomyces sp. ICBB 8177]PWI45042.1 hypothetical protein CK485_07685 [Streptomyces sp. ICBB 8177]
MYITTRIDGATAAITPHGEIDHDALPGLLEAARALPATVTSVTWDLYHVPFMDAAGLHLLSRPQSDGPTPRFVGLRPQPQRLIRQAARLFPAAPWACATAG